MVVAWSGVRLFRRPQAARTVTVAQMRDRAKELRRRSRRALIQIFVVVPLIAGVLVVYGNRQSLFHSDLPVRVASALALAALGWWLARDIGRALAPALFRRLDPGTAGTVGFVIRLALLATTLLVALRFGGLQSSDIAVGGAFTAVILGIAAQNTLGNVFSGLILLSARPFRVGERVRLQAGALAGQLEGVVSSLGLLYVIFTRGDDIIMVPNTVVMSAAIVPLREPASVDLRAHLSPDIKPSSLQDYLERNVSIPTRTPPHIAVEELDEESVVMRVTATPERDVDGPRLADEILSAISDVIKGSYAEERR